MGDAFISFRRHGILSEALSLSLVLHWQSLGLLSVQHAVTVLIHNARTGSDKHPEGTRGLWGLLGLWLAVSWVPHGPELVCCTELVLGF